MCLGSGHVPCSLSCFMLGSPHVPIWFRNSALLGVFLFSLFVFSLIGLFWKAIALWLRASRHQRHHARTRFCRQQHTPTAADQRHSATSPVAELQNSSLGWLHHGLHMCSGLGIGLPTKIVSQSKLALLELLQEAGYLQNIFQVSIRKFQ